MTNILRFPEPSTTLANRPRDKGALAAESLPLTEQSSTAFLNWGDDSQNQMHKALDPKRDTQPSPQFLTRDTMRRRLFQCLQKL